MSQCRGGGGTEKQRLPLPPAEEGEALDTRSMLSFSPESEENRPEKASLLLLVDCFFCPRPKTYSNTNNNWYQGRGALPSQDIANVCAILWYCQGIAPPTKNKKGKKGRKKKKR